MKSHFSLKAVPLIAGFTLVVIALVAVIYPLKKKSRSDSNGAAELNRVAATDRVGSAPDHRIQSDKIGRSQSSQQSKTSSDYLGEWTNSSSLLSGAELKEEQYRIAREAMLKLHGVEMGMFIQGLFDLGGGEVANWLASTGSVVIFSGSQNERNEAMTWLVSLSNTGLQNTIASQAGRLLSKEDVVSVMSKISSPQVASTLLLGYCRSNVQLDPYGSVKAFIDFQPKGADFSGLKSIVSSLPDGADYEAISKMLPPDSKSIAKDIRSELLKKWAEKNPVAALKFISENAQVIDASQVVVVASTWATTAPDAAISWIDGLPVGDTRDACLSKIAVQKAYSNPKLSWELALKISSESKRKVAFKDVYNDWVKSDARAANAAMSSILSNEN